MLMRFQKDVMGIGLEATHDAFWKRICLHFVHGQNSLGDCLKSYMMEGASRQCNIQTAVWVLLGAVSQICNENWKQKAEHEDLENLQFVQKRSMCKVPAKECEIAEEISTTKMKLSTLYWGKENDALRISQKSAKPTFQSKSCKSVKCFQRLSL
jgi:hypothetical protein